MEIDINDGYNPNRWAKFRQPSNNRSINQTVKAPYSPNFRGNLNHDDRVSEEAVSRVKKMGTNDTSQPIRYSRLFLSQRPSTLQDNSPKTDSGINPNNEASIKNNHLVDLYV